MDESPELLRAAAEKHFHGDLYALIEEYYRTLARVVEKTGADIIGHFDLISKFNEGGALFDEAAPRYLAAAQKAADILLKTGRPFEINTGGHLPGLPHFALSLIGPAGLYPPKRRQLCALQRQPRERDPVLWL